MCLFAACGDDDHLQFAAAPVTVERSADRIRVRSTAAAIDLYRSPYRLEWRDAADTLLTQERESGIFYERAGTQHQLTAIMSDRSLADGVQLAVSTTEGPAATVTVRFVRPRTAEITVEPPAPDSLTAVGDRWVTPVDEVIYGLTSRLRDSRVFAPVGVPVEDLKPVEVGSLNRRGETVEMFVRPTIALYTPFYQSSRGYGLAVSGTAAGLFDVAKSDPQTLAFRFEAATSTESRRLRFHLFVGPAHATILDEYTNLTGRPFVPPDWAFLHWRWRGELENGAPAELDGVPMNAQFVDDVTMYERLGIPAGVYLFDRPVLEGEFGFARFTWDEARLPNPEAMLAALKRRGYRTLMWSGAWACGSGAADNGTEAQRLGFLAPGSTGTPKCADVGGGSFILDVTNPAARQWFREKLRDFVARYDIGGIKLDRGEEHIPSEASDIWADGRTGREVHNDYVGLQTAMHRQAMSEARGADFLVITRSGYAGTQRDAIVWGGDVTAADNLGLGASTDLGLRSRIISQQRAAFMGFPIWGSDTGGYYEFKNREVFARWLEFSTFSGIMEIGGKGAHAPWAMPTEPHYDDELIAIYRRYTLLRHRLQPYLVRAARDAGATGLPIARPLVFAFPDDTAVRDLWDEYLFGPDLLVAPVWKTGARSRSIYLPRGQWRSFWDESLRFEGPATITIDVPLDTIPVFIRADVPNPVGE